MKSEIINLRVEAEIKELIELMAKRENKSVGSFLRTKVEDRIQQLMLNDGLSYVQAIRKAKSLIKAEK